MAVARPRPDHEDAATVDWLIRRRTEGDAIVLHGYDEAATKKRRSEFATLQAHEANLRLMGADLVGMSTVLEAIAARAAGLEIFGLSLVTNLAAGLTGAPLDHHEVLEAGAGAATRMGTLVRDLVAGWSAAPARPG